MDEFLFKESLLLISKAIVQMRDLESVKELFNSTNTHLADMRAVNSVEYGIQNSTQNG